MRDLILKGFLLTISNANTQKIVAPENSRNQPDIIEERKLNLRKLS